MSKEPPLAENLKKLREKQGLSQGGLAKLADVANNTIIKIEQGKNINPMLSTLRKIAEALDVGIDELIIKHDVNVAVAPNSIDLSPSADDLIRFAVEIWRIGQKVAKLTEIQSENQRKGLENAVQRLKRYLEKNDIEIVDYTNQKFNDGLNLDVLDMEKDPTIPESIIKETVEPTVMHHGQVVKRAKIIVLSK